MKQIDQTKSIGVIIKDLQYPFFNSLAAGIKEYAENKGYSVFISISSNRNENKFSNMVFFKYIKGIIIDPIIEDVDDIEYLFQLKTMNCPIVLLEDVKGIKANVVTVDLLGSVKKVVKYLIDNGHKKIIHFSGSLNAYRTIKRIEGFKLAFSESSLAFKKDMIVPIGISFHDGYYHTLRYFENLERENYPTAIVCSNDHQALAVIAALKQLNIQVPDDISIIGYEDIFHGESYPVPLTTIRTPQLEIGMTAARILIDNIESSTTKEDERIEISSEFIVGRTSKILN